MRKLLAMFAATALASGAAIAGDKNTDYDTTKEKQAHTDYQAGAYPMQPSFDELDVTSDAQIDPEEAREYRALTQVFANFDSDEDGELNKDEYAAARDYLANDAARR